MIITRTEYKARMKRCFQRARFANQQGVIFSKKGDVDNANQHFKNRNAYMEMAKSLREEFSDSGISHEWVSEHGCWMPCYSSN